MKLEIYKKFDHSTVSIIDEFGNREVIINHYSKFALNEDEDMTGMEDGSIIKHIILINGSQFNYTELSDPVLVMNHMNDMLRQRKLLIPVGILAMVFSYLKDTMPNIKPFTFEFDDIEEQ